MDIADFDLAALLWDEAAKQTGGWGWGRRESSRAGVQHQEILVVRAHVDMLFS